MSSIISDLKNWRFEVDFEGLAWATIDCPGQSMNTLSQRSFEDLLKIVTYVEEAALKNEVRGLILTSGKDDNFIAGADIGEFDLLDSEEKVHQLVQEATSIFRRLEVMKVPVVAAIDGFCLGGGLELAMACHYRIATRREGTRLGLPEVKLGIFPGLHGTVRMLRLAGPIKGMQNMLTGRMLRSGPARAMGLVDQLVAGKGELRWAVRKAALQNRRSKKSAVMHKLMRTKPIRYLLARQMRQKTAEKIREDHYPAPFRLIDLFEQYGGDEKQMLKQETVSFAPLMVSQTSRNLRRVFRLSEDMKAQAAKDYPQPLRAHIIGAGTMGADIAAWCVVCGMDVSLQDLSEEAIDKAIKGAGKLFKKRLKKPVAIEAAHARFHADPDGRGIARADIIIEAVVENLEIKQKLFKSIEEAAKPAAILATNTSSLPLEDISRGLKNPSRLIGVHFFNPVAKMPLVEIVRAKNSDDEVVKRGCAFVTAIKKYPLIVKSSPGFLVNRVLAPYLMEAMKRYEGGEGADKIDQAAVAFGMPMGPLELADIVGLDICKHVAEILGLGEMSEGGEDSEIERLVLNHKLGQKTGEGFYVWENNKPKRSDEIYDQDELIALGKDLIQPMLDACQTCHQENIAASSDLIDGGVIFGTGFAPFRGGPLHYLADKET